MADADLQLRDVVPPEPLLPAPGPPTWALALVAIGVALGLWTLWLWWRRRGRRPAADPPLDRDAIYRTAVAGLEQARTLSRREAALHLSTELRTYLARACEDSSIFETHEEFMDRHDALQSYPEEVRSEVATVLTRLANEKYDRGDEAADSASWIDETRRVLDHLHQRSPA